MARLTNRQMEVLAARVTDLLQEAHDEQVKEVVESKEYLKFEETFEDEHATKLRNLAKNFKIADKAMDDARDSMNMIRAEAKTIQEKIVGYTLPTWSSTDPETALKSYLETKKNETFKGTKFDRDKTLRRVEADILLSDVANPEELVKSLVEKLKK